jgi:integrase
LGLSLSDIREFLEAEAMKAEAPHGAIRTEEKCPICRLPFTEIPRIGFLCIEHKTSPRRFYLDLHHKGERFRIFSDKKGRVLSSYPAVIHLQTDISREIQDCLFDPSKYVRRKQEEFWISNLLDRFQKQRIPSLAPSYQKDYLRMIGLAGDFFGPADVRDIRKLDMIKYKDHLEAKYSFAPKTRKNILDLFRSFLRYCRFDLEILDSVPSMPEMQVPEPKFKWVDHDAQLDLFEHVPQQDRPIIGFLMLHGIRPGEARALRLKDFDLERQVFTVSSTWSGNQIRDRRKGRGAKPLTLPLHPEMIDIVKSRAKGALPEAYLFVNPRNGRPYSQNKLRRVWEAVRVSAGISRDLRLYDATRHSFASQLINSGTDISSVSRLLGHSSLKMTMRYAHHEVGKLRTDLEKLSLLKVVSVRGAVSTLSADGKLVQKT